MQKLVLFIILCFLNVSIWAQSQNQKSPSDSKSDPSPEWVEDPDKKTKIRQGRIYRRRSQRQSPS